MKKFVKAAGILVLVLSAAAISFGEAALPKNKQTVLDLYVTAKEVFEKQQITPDNIKIIDVRTPEEYIFIGHVSTAVNIPIEFLEQSWNAEKKRPVMKTNTHFVSDVKKKFSSTDTLYVMCRSGNRSARAINMLAEAGFKSAYNIIGGFEGDKVKDKGSLYNGRRMVNGWKNSEAPWTYKLNPELMYVPGSN
ncbi:MAG: rhodanese-like domain-containing protein [Desulfobacterales bacterium]|nr:rhodanese-like domain-containing protein [Desulfobacterales bacterium]